MELLFKRQQTVDTAGRLKFKLWGQTELDADEQEIIRRYKFDKAILIAMVQPNLMRATTFIAFGAFILAGSFIGIIAGTSLGLLVGVIAGGGAGFWYFNEKRETIFVRDLIRGRYFSCSSVVELARKEAWLEMVCSYLRQVMESAKHWEGTQRYTIEPLPKEEAKQMMIRGIGTQVPLHLASRLHAFVHGLFRNGDQVETEALYARVLECFEEHGLSNDHDRERFINELTTDVLIELSIHSDHPQLVPVALLVDQM